MVKWLKKSAHIFCVPAVLLGEGLIFCIVFLLWQSGGSMPTPVRVLLALALTLLGMYLLRKVSMRKLLLSSGVACLIALAASLLPPFSTGSTVLSAVYQFLYLFITAPNNLLMPITALSRPLSPALAVLFTAVQVLFPLVYVFSGLLSRLGSSLRRNTGV